MIEVKYSGHWLTLVAPLEQDVHGVLKVLGGSFSPATKGGQFGQPHKVVHESGTTVHFGAKREDQPVTVNLSGEVCEGWWDWGLEKGVELGAGVTRVDYAADVGPDDQARSRLVQMVKEWKRGRVKTKMRVESHSMIRSDRPGDGWTAYFGGKQADLQLRCYDKRGPLRLEAQWRPPKGQALSVAAMTRQKGVEACWRSLFKSAVWPMPWYQKLLAGEATERAIDPQASATFLRAVVSAQDQLGLSLWAMNLLGVRDDDLRRVPGEEIRGDQAAKLLRWADEADRHGYDGSALRAAVKRRMRKADAD